MAFIIAQRTRPLPGFEVNGDGIVVRERTDDTFIAVIDGVGHGPKAADATDAACAYFRSATEPDLHGLMLGCNRVLAGTRGAAVSVVQMARDGTTLCYLGVGNIGGYLWTPDGMQTLLTHNGMVGRLNGAPHPIQYATLDHQLLVMHSDGIPSRSIRGTMEQWDGRLETQADRLMAHASERDDACVLVAQIRHPNGLAGSV